MINKEAIGLIDHRTVIKRLAEIEYKNGFHGKEACAHALKKAETQAIEALEKQIAKRPYYEGDGYDLIVMGRSEGEGCYCYVNGILREQTDKLSDAYEYLVIDNEAGMEHLSRKTTKHIDKLLLVSDCSRRSVQAVARIRDLARELNLSVGDIYLIVNKAPNGELNEGIKEEIDKHNLNLIGVVPMDEMIYEYDSSGIPLVNLPEDSKAKIAINDIMAKLELN